MDSIVKKGDDNIGLLSAIFKSKNKQKEKVKNSLKVLSSSSVYTRRLNASELYNNHSVRKVINKIAGLVASTPIKYYSNDSEGKTKDNTKETISWLLQHQASSILTSYLFFKQMVARVLLFNNSFAWIKRDVKTNEPVELIPMLTKSYQLVSPEGFPEYLYVKFTLDSGDIKVLPIEDIIHFTGDFLNDEYFGDNIEPEIEVVSINDDLWSNLVKWTQANSTIKGFLKTDTILNDEDRKSAQDEFSDLLQKSGSAYMTLDGKYDYIPINDKTSPMDVNYIEKIESTVKEFYYINKAIIDGSATPQQIESFHQLTLNPIFTMIEQELESKLLSQKQILGFGHKIKFVCSNFAHMTSTERVSAFTLLTNTGAVSRNELREGFGFSRLEGLDSLMYSKNFAEVGKTEETSNDENENNKQNEEEE